MADVSGTQLTLPYLNQTGFRNPVLVEEVEGLGLGMPDPVSFYLFLNIKVQQESDILSPKIQKQLKTKLRELN